MKLFAVCSSPKKETIDYLNAIFFLDLSLNLQLARFLFCNKLFAIFQHNRSTAIKNVRKAHMANVGNV